MLLVKEANLKKQPTEWLHLHDLPAELGRQCKADPTKLNSFHCFSRHSAGIKQCFSLSYIEFS